MDVPCRIGDSRDGVEWGPTLIRLRRREGSGPEGEPNRSSAPPPRRWWTKANYRTTRERGSRTRQHAGVNPADAGPRRQCRWDPGYRWPRVTTEAASVAGRNRRSPTRRRHQDPV